MEITETKRTMLTKKTFAKRAFTLIELLVVILILAILAALVVPRLFGHTDEAKRAKAMTDIKELENALERFRVDTDRFPSTEEGLNALVVRPSDVKVWNGPYVKQIPTDPWQNEYAYEDLGENTVLLKSFGADGAEGGEGNNADIANIDEGQPEQ